MPKDNQKLDPKLVLDLLMMLSFIEKFFISENYLKNRQPKDEDIKSWLKFSKFKYNERNFNMIKTYSDNLWPDKIIGFNFDIDDLLEYCSQKF